MRVNTLISRIINFGIFFCSVEGLQVGLLSPIEVVEEYGCHDTELRLTCGNFDSKLAILEAAFAPNCTHHECLQFDVRRLVQSLSIKETEESKNAERKAAQTFLETLQQSHSSDEEIDLALVEDALTEDENNNAQTNKNVSLRVVLERLIIRYLRQLSPEDELDETLSRPRRSTINKTHSNLERSSSENVDSNVDTTRLQSTRAICDEQKRQISSLKLLDLQRSYSNQSDYEYSIRNVLNKRCSGKNHCSFVFAIDHPFAKIWKGGVVRIKYMCMEDFRINRYCGEHLDINFEIDPNKQFDDVDENGPIAQPRKQPRETFLHSLKIIKADERIGSIAMNISRIPADPRKIKTTVPIKQLDKEVGAQKRIYSQDFKLLKILPSDIDNLKDIESVGNQIYFRNEETSDMEDNSTETTILVNSGSNNKSSSSHRNEKDKDEKAEGNLDNANDALENVTITIREGGNFFTVYNNLSKNFKNTPSNIAVDRGKYAFEINLNANIFQNTSLPTTSAESDEIKTMNISNVETDEKTGLHKLQENDLQKLKKLGERAHISSYRQSLLHGFAMTPGYPKFYIGEFECYWNIMAPENIRIRISILDISLRYDNICKDYLQIDDVGSGKMLFNGCADAVYPIGIVSSSNLIKVTIKTTSKFAYPKRGILLHYTADGCINPPIPANVKLVDRTATTAFYECLPSFLFPDSRHSTRKLTCNNFHVWDKLLPNCIEQEKLFRRAVLSEDKLKLINKKPDLYLVKNKMSSQKDADMIFDIIIPSILIAGLFIINGVIFAIIMKYRQRFVESEKYRKQLLKDDLIAVLYFELQEVHTQRLTLLPYNLVSSLTDQII